LIFDKHKFLYQVIQKDVVEKIENLEHLVVEVVEELLVHVVHSFVMLHENMHQQHNWLYVLVLVAKNKQIL
jgi:hypothetical protein